MVKRYQCLVFKPTKISDIVLNEDYGKWKEILKLSNLRNKRKERAKQHYHNNVVITAPSYENITTIPKITLDPASSIIESVLENNSTYQESNATEPPKLNLEIVDKDNDSNANQVSNVMEPPKLILELVDNDTNIDQMSVDLLDAQIEEAIGNISCD